jgi:hypothetical protein
VHRLLLSAKGRSFEGLSKQDLLWQRPDLPSSVETSLGPRLESLGQVPAPNTDFLRLAALVFFCDRTVKRPPMLRREFELDVAVSDPDRWSPHSERLAALLALLTGDHWSLGWTRRREAARSASAGNEPRDVSLLFSGGADSVSGAVAAHVQGLDPLLVSHSDSSSIKGQQNAAHSALETALEKTFGGVHWRFSRSKRQVGSNEKFRDEPSRRSRSLLFIALGAAVNGAVEGKSLWVAENGFTSLNPPLVPESGGALSTRTTHPAFLLGLSEVLGDIGLDLALNNIFVEKTKGEVFAEVAAELGPQGAASLLSATHSCGKAPQGLKGIPPSIHCGFCLGCMVRRGAFKSADLEDDTRYAVEELSTTRRKKWLKEYPDRLVTVNAVRARLETGFDDEDVLQLGLPDDADLDGALDLMQRGLAELGMLDLP